MSLLSALASNPSLVLRHRNIFLLSHMRANTSLLGHLLGSHPQIEGYYEMHIGYYSWKSLWRQKMLHFADHDAKPGARYMFDKVLHDGHAVAMPLLERRSSSTILMLREPTQSIRSLVVLYREHLPAQPEAEVEGAARYYIDRLKSLARVARDLRSPYFYLDAELIVSDTAPTLAALGDWLQLSSPIPTEYGVFNRTGSGAAGDHSARLKSGKVAAHKRSYDEIEIPAALHDEALQAYAEHRATLIGRAQRSVQLAATT
ncbi:MAG: hypothetical protein KGJ30_20065 [Burkholderiales bacterium]|nr:hypothetical protein [Burkholderiales bacterium]MDE1925777.1 hypothetical protein [Burkholderiales bacterium]MDE2161211.1 hypothetical protein [Burkholderiales bacterium]